MQMQKIEISWIEDRLKRISAQLIEAHRSGNEQVISHYAAQAGIAPAGPGQAKRLFMRVIQVFHPDRAGLFLQQVSDCESRGDAQGLSRIEALLQFAAFSNAGGHSPRGRAHGETRQEGRGSARTASSRGWASRGDDSDDIYEEEYGYDEDDFDDSESTDAADYERDPYDTEDEEEFFEGSFMEALKREVFGNLDLYPSKAEIEQYEGELDLSDYAINDLSGAEFCKNITNLNLAANDIDNVWPLRGLAQLEFLDLSSNDLEDADELGNLVNLKEIDLSFNEIDDMRFLERMSSLTAVSVVGNPVRDKSVFDRLRAKGVLVID